MPEAVPIALGMWVAVCVVLFRILPGRDAALVALIGGWAVLPTGSYPPSTVPEPVGGGGTAHAVAVPTGMLANKATAIGLGCLCGSMLFGWSAVRRIRPSWIDLPVAAWCLVPLASALANGLTAVDGISQARYLVLAWGVPYLMGRAYLTDSEGLGRLGLGLVLAGLAYAPLCLVEFASGPFLYGLAYGAHPYQVEGAGRLVGHRPLVYLEHGNQLGMWVASAAVSAVWLWASGRLPPFLRGRVGATAAGLAALCLLCQSHGAIVLAAAAAWPVVLMKLRSRRDEGLPRRTAALAASGVMVVAVVLAGAAAALRPAVAFEHARSALSAVGKGSFSWRVGRSQQFLPRVAERPVFGWGRADWSSRADGTFVNPVNMGLWLLEAGMYGGVGLTCATALLAWPAASALRRLPPRAWLSPAGSAVSLASVLLLMNLADSLLNSGWLVPLTAAAGGLNGWSLRKDREAGDRSGSAGVRT